MLYRYIYCALKDASFNTYHDGKCHYGYDFFLCADDAAFYSVSKRMKVLPLSSTEAEYVAFFKQTADLFTKALGRTVFEPLRAQLLNIELNIYYTIHVCEGV